MLVTAQEICALLRGQLEGDPEAKVDAPAKIEEATETSICFLADAKYEDFAYTTKAAVLLVNNEFTPKQPVQSTLIRVDDVRLAVATLLNHFGSVHQKKDEGIDESASIHSSVKIGNGVTIGKFAIIEEGAEIGDNSVIYGQVFVGKNVKLGAGCKLYPGVKIYHSCILGASCIIHSNVVIGGDGFGFAPDGNGQFQKVAQIGNVILEDNVEVGANTTIDRATMGSTILRKGVKLDNLIMVAHNVEIGANTVIAAQAGIAGSTVVGENCLIGGQVGVVGHIKIAAGTRIQAQSGVAAPVKEENSKLYGSPALDYSNYLKSYAVFKNLPQIKKKLNWIEQILEEKG